MSILLTIFILAAISIAIFAAESDNFIFTTTTIIATFATLDVVFGVPIWATILTNPLTIIMFIFAYVIVGAIYTAIWRWPEFLRERVISIQDSYACWAKSHKDSTKQDFVNSHSYSQYTASYNSEKLANWVLAWPFSLAWELARKPTIWLWNSTYELLGNMFERVGKRVTNKILQDK
jgi:hypothetical protein